MYTGKMGFARLMDFLPRHDFDACVRRYRGNARVREFSCRDQFLTMAFAQRTYRESLRDIETCLRALEPKLYHAGFRGKVSRGPHAPAGCVAQVRAPRRYPEFVGSPSRPPDPSHTAIGPSSSRWSAARRRWRDNRRPSTDSIDVGGILREAHAQPTRTDGRA